tara:strand:+ start:1962 stop:3155 length:1194 start_codon:yes stop_codon:yes gene_type:complete
MSDTLIDILREYIPRKKQIEIELSHALNKKYTCANPNGPVSNDYCPPEDPLCGCPCKEIIPKSAQVVTIEWAANHVYEFSSNEVMIINMEVTSEDPSPWVTIKGVYEDKSETEEDEGDQTTSGGNNPTYELFPDSSTCFHDTKEEAIEKITSEYEDTGGYTMDEPTKEYMDKLLKESSECPHIESELGASWLGCDWEDPNSPMSCDCPCVGEDYYKYLRYNTSVASFWDTPPEIPILSIAQRAALNSQKIGISVYGNLSIRPGDIIKLNITDVQLPDAEEILNSLSRKYGLLTSQDKYAKFSGHWMVLEIKHRIYGLSHHKMDLILVRDGLPAIEGDEEPEPGAEEQSSIIDNFVPINVERVSVIPTSSVVVTTVEDTEDEDAPDESQADNDTDYGY